MTKQIITLSDNAAQRIKEIMANAIALGDDFKAYIGSCGS